MAALMIPPAAAPAFLAASGWGDGVIEPLAGDASFRRYFRVVAPGRTAVLMDAPPAHEDVAPFLAVAGHLIERGLSAPRAVARDAEAGLLLLEDFGDRVVGPVLIQEPEREAAIYAQAVDVLRALRARPAPAGLAPYDAAAMRREVRLFTEWYAPAVGLTADTVAFDDAWAMTWGDVERQAIARRALVLRDYHVDNIMLLDRPGLAGLGLLDFQDALAGHPAYDLVSLLQDARRDVARPLETAMLARYLEGAGEDEAAFRAAYEVLGAQRNVKILGIFTRLWKRDGKPHYLRHQARIWGYLERNLAHPALAPVAAWFDANVPASARAAAWESLPA